MIGKRTSYICVNAMLFFVILALATAGCGDRAKSSITSSELDGAVKLPPNSVVISIRSAMDGPPQAVPDRIVTIATVTTASSLPEIEAFFRKQAPGAEWINLGDTKKIGFTPPEFLTGESVEIVLPSGKAAGSVQTRYEVIQTRMAARPEPTKENPVKKK